MKTISTTLAALFAGALFACSSQNDPNGASSPVVGDPTADGGVAMGDGGANSDGGQGDGAAAMDGGASSSTTCGPGFQVCSDEQILAIDEAGAAGEVMLAQSVVDRLTTPSVKAFAQRMITDHGKELSDTKALAAKLGMTPQENGLSQELTDEANDEVKTLSSKSGQELDQDYIRYEILDHLGDLGQIDHILYPSAHAAELKSSILDDDRPLIASHLQNALAADVDVDGDSCGGGNNQTGGEQ